ncbi:MULTISPECIES: MBL fold metallo-hydrolase [Romboutsia]|uniref:Metallo-beta-lactamase super protein n=1 Tax=Romboutsia hominis TaxID=1507512 RepID=A0A2P2BUN4_9FIRM|nr:MULTISPECIES: MBL fold metallo-hydrolase [Romboutsia]MCH1959111.1 MBL fold metallo-hydrolase [Romboutsia hominis]MDB8789476.1 MBL fold metallo-hydrolase [Romboutsia sp. 1001216sp1]MDB8802619.1 MBL fold metallo-hydrolase [Romboutsia sp. 1001216sp1]MDB8805439.1 MBL fold metallo-hydrolase [Romboutsia sp. 1001216sp1]MDB8807347.1 MBL fold metallo-hydrolase [Romboutsia sp. 1001216sp1]
MELKKIKGNTFYIKGGTNTGVYIFDDNKALIIDPGLAGSRPKRIINMLEEKNIKVNFIINTHEHDDHYGACNQFKEYYNDICILSSDEAKLYIEKPYLFGKYIMGGKYNRFFVDKLKNKSLDEIKVDKIAKEGSLLLNNEEFEIIDLKGHTEGSIGILTKDKVLFTGDLLIGLDMLKKYDFLFLYDIKKEIDSIMKLKEIDFDYLVLGHSKEVISKKDSKFITEMHLNAIDKYLNKVREDLNVPITLEELLKKIIIDNNLKCNYKEYHFFKSSLVSMISYLADLDEIDYILNDGELLYCTKKK